MDRLAPTLVAHADWGTGSAKKWMACATVDPDGRWTAAAPWQLASPELGSLLSDLLDRAGLGGTVLAGFDFPIGVPAAWAARAGVPDFLKLLPELGRPGGQWSSFFEPAASGECISLRRPFYPGGRCSGTCFDQLINGLALTSRDELLRACDRNRVEGRQACPLFWLVGPSQVGKAAISGWREVLQPGLGQLGDRISIWPFGGRLADLLRPDHAVVTETYPAEFYGHLGVDFRTTEGLRSGKRDPEARRHAGGALLQWANSSGVLMSPKLAAGIQTGFDVGAAGEDRFDAVVGLFGMLNLVLGLRPHEEPSGDAVRLVEGWMLGRAFAVEPTSRVGRPMDGPSICKSPMHSKITGDFAEGLVLYWLSKYGFECAKVDHTGIDLIAVDPSTGARLGISVKSRCRDEGREGHYLSIPNDSFEKADRACKVFACVPHFALVIDQGSEIWLFLVTMADLLALYPLGKSGTGWYMGGNQVAKYLADPRIKVVKFEYENVRW